jgi:hypothetical protein
MQQQGSTRAALLRWIGLTVHRFAGRSTIRLLAALAALLGGTPHGETAETDRVVEAEYLVTFLGLPVYTARLRGTLSATRYEITFEAEPQGIARLASNTRVAWETRGAVGATGYEPHSFRQNNSWRKQTRRIELAFAADTDPVVRVVPPESPGKRPRVPEDLRRGTVDPLTAVLAAVSAEPERAPCDFRARVFEGLRRTDVHLRESGRDTLSIEVPGASSEAAVCLMHFERVAGYEPKSFKDNPEPLPPAKVWVVRVADAKLWLPVRLRFDSRYGPVSARLTRLGQRTEPR